MIATTDWISWLGSLLVWGTLLTAIDAVVVCLAIGHVILNKRDVRAAIGWSGVIFFAPFVGSALYLMFGVNRSARKARKLFGKAPLAKGGIVEAAEPIFSSTTLLGPMADQFGPLAMLGDKVTGRPLVSGNHFELFASSDLGFDAMLAAIERSTKSVTLCTYIFDPDEIGKRFVAALAAAKDRGVDVKVIIDGLGMRYAWPSIKRFLAAAGVPFAVFLPTLIPWKLHYSNLRCHRKILVIDGRIGFTGGMNIRQGLARPTALRQSLVDSHFYIEGPVVRHLQEVFAEDWEFCTGEQLDGERFFPEIPAHGEAIARGIADGPDLTLDNIRLTLAGAITAARKSISIVTPYFLPDASLIEALNVADLRGVDVKIILPAVNNLALVQWASMAQLWQLLNRGVQVWMSPPPFDHSKLLVVDEQWCMFGSANWDSRSLRLNFEFNVECYSPAVAGATANLIRQKIAISQPLTLADVEGRSLPIKLRDGLARLATPFL